MTGFQTRSFSASHNLRASLRRMFLRAFSSGGAPVKGRPLSTKYQGSWLQLFRSQWNRAVLAVLGSWIQAYLLITTESVCMYWLGMDGWGKVVDPPF